MALPPRGDFSFLNDEMTREALSDAFVKVEAIPGGWNALLPEPGGAGFWYTTHAPGSIIQQISNSIGEFDHTAGTHAYTMRQMQGIARLGWDQWATLHINRQAAGPAAPGRSSIPSPESYYFNVKAPSVRDQADYVYNDVCPVCFEVLVNDVVVIDDNTHPNGPNGRVTCGHKYHKDCINSWIKNKVNPQCPMCRSPIVYIRPSPPPGKGGRRVKTRKHKSKIMKRRARGGRTKYKRR